MQREIPREFRSGYGMLAILTVIQIAGLVGIVVGARTYTPSLIVASALLSAANFVLWFGFFMVHPNQAKVVQLFGRYVGTAKATGLRWGNPFYSKTAVSLRVRNFESSQLKVNDHSGSPIEIAAVVVWKVVDTAEAVFEVDDYEEFVSIQSEAALRNLATSYSYEHHGDENDVVSLRSHPVKIAEALKQEVQERLEKAGVHVIEARISHLAYAPEIASAMLRRQQASAVISARKQLVAGAVGMVEMALGELNRNNIVELDEERRAAMVSNLLVVLCGEENARPVVNAGSLYT